MATARGRQGCQGFASTSAVAPCSPPTGSATSWATTCGREYRYQHSAAVCASSQQAAKPARLAWEGPQRSSSASADSATRAAGEIAIALCARCPLPRTATGRLAACLWEGRGDKGRPWPSSSEFRALADLVCRATACRDISDDVPGHACIVLIPPRLPIGTSSAGHPTAAHVTLSKAVRGP